MHRAHVIVCICYTNRQLFIYWDSLGFKTLALLNHTNVNHAEINLS